MLTLQATTHIEGNDRIDGPIWNYPTGTLTPWKGYSTGLRYPTQLWEKTHPCKLVARQPEHGRASTTEEQKL